MESRILFLGTGGDSIVVGKQMRGSGGIIFNIEKNQFHLDPGPGALLMAKMMSLNLRENTALFLTGNDLFRASDANAVASAMTHDGMDRRGVLVCPSSLIMDSGKETSPFMNRFYAGCLEKTILVDNTKRMAINNIDIEVIELGTPTGETAGFRFITPKFSLAYVPDTPYSAAIAESLKGTDVLILGIPDPKSFKRKDHMNSEDAAKIIRKVSPQIAVITGFGIKMIQADPLYEARELQKETSTHVISAKDGMTINPMSFTTAVRQKSLTTF